jgi:pilus assembly protein Flp/PilA
MRAACFAADSLVYPNWRFSYVDLTMCLFWKILSDEEAATAVEYAVMLAMILLSIIGAIGLVGGETQGMWDNIEADLQAHGF